MLEVLSVNNELVKTYGRSLKFFCQGKVGWQHVVFLSPSELIEFSWTDNFASRRDKVLTSHVENKTINFATNNGYSDPSETILLSGARNMSDLLLVKCSGWPSHVKASSHWRFWPDTCRPSEFRKYKMLEFLSVFFLPAQNTINTFRGEGTNLKV